MKIAYGHTVKSVDDIYVRMIEETGGEMIRLGNAGALIVDFIPIRT